MKKRLALLSLMIAATSYASDEFFYEDGSSGEEASSVRLEESVISGVGYETTVRNTPKNVQVISSKEIEEKNYQDVTEILRDSPLVTIREDAFGPIVEMRGSGNNSKATVQVLVDGVNINPVDINHGTLPLNSIPASGIEKIEILPGGSGVIYGDGATGGVVNIITKAAASGEPSIYAGARYGSNANKQWEAGAGGRIGEDLLLQVNYSGTDRQGNRDEEEYERQYVDISAKYDITHRDRLNFKYAHTTEDRTSADLLTRAQLTEDRGQSGIDFDGVESDLAGNGDIADRSELTRDEFMGTYERDITDRLTFNLKASYQKTETDSHTRDLTTGWKEGMDDAWFNSGNYYADTIGTFTDEKYRVSPKIKYDYAEDSYLIVGYDYTMQKSMRDFDNFTDLYEVYELDTEKESHAGYVFNKTSVGSFEFMQGFRREWTYFDFEKSTHYHHQVMAPSTPGWITGLPGGVVDTGLQKETHSKSMRNDAFEFAVNYLYSDTGNIYARFEQSFRTPAPTEFQDKDGTNYIYNDLDAETSQTIELGVNDYVLGSFVSATVFGGRTKDEIFYEEVEHGKEWYYNNLGETQRYGIELSAEQYLGKFTFFENFSYVKTEITENESDTSIEGNEVPYASRMNFNIGTKYNFTSRLNTVVKVNYKDGYYLDRANEFEAGSTITTDMTINYTMENGLKLYTGINNLFNRNNYDRTGLSGGEMVYDPADERSYYAGFKYEF